MKNIISQDRSCGSPTFHSCAHGFIACILFASHGFYVPDSYWMFNFQFRYKLKRHSVERIPPPRPVMSRNCHY